MGVGQPFITSSGRKPIMSNSQNTSDCRTSNLWVRQMELPVSMGWLYSRSRHQELQPEKWFNGFALVYAKEGRREKSSETKISFSSHFTEDSSALGLKIRSSTPLHYTAARVEVGIFFVIVCVNDNLDGKKKHTGIVPVNIAFGSSQHPADCLAQNKGQTRCAE